MKFNWNYLKTEKKRLLESQIIANNFDEQAFEPNVNENGEKSKERKKRGSSWIMKSKEATWEAEKEER